MHVWQVLQRLWENKVFVKQEKCEFHIPSVTFLGYILEGGQVRPDPAKVQATAQLRKVAPEILGLRQFLQTIHEELQPGSSSPHKYNLSVCSFCLVSRSGGGVW